MSLDKPMNVGVLVGSLRKASLNRMLANALISLTPASAKLDIVEIGQLPLYNQDLDIDPPAVWTAWNAGLPELITPLTHCGAGAGCEAGVL